MSKANIDAIYALETLIELIKPIMSKYNNPFNEGNCKEWEKYCSVPYTFFESIKKICFSGRIQNSLYLNDLIPYVYNLLLRNAVMDVGVYRSQGGYGSPIEEKTYPIIFDDLIPIISEWINIGRGIEWINIERGIKENKMLPRNEHPYIENYIYYINDFYAPITNRKRLLELIIQLELEYGSDKNIVDDLRNQLITICLKEKFENIGFIEKYYNLYCEERRLCKALYESEEMFRIFRDRLKGATILSNRERNSIAELNKNIKERENDLNNFKIPVLYKYYKPEIKKLYLERKRERRLSTDATVGW